MTLLRVRSNAIYDTTIIDPHIPNSPAPQNPQRSLITYLAHSVC